MSSDDKEFLGKEPVGKLLFRLALPTVAAQLINMLYNIVDRIYIGHMPGDGALALTGVGVCLPIILIVSAFSALVGAGGAPRASIFMGRKEYDNAEKTLSNSFTLQIAISVLLTAVLLIWGDDLLLAFGASSNTIGYASDYLRIYAIGTIFVQLTLGMNMFISAQGFSKISMLTVVIGAVTNIILDPVFIFGFGMGVRGAALATILSQAISAVWAIRFLTGQNTVLRLKKEHLKIRSKVLLPCIGLGVAPFVMQSTESILVLCFNSSLLKYGGDLAVGAMTILSSVMQFALLPLQGLTQGGQPIISFNYGAGNADRVKEAFKMQTICCVSFAAILWILSELTPGIFVAVFTSDPELSALASWALRIYMGSVVLMGLQISCQQTFIAFGNSKVSAFLAIFRKILVLIPLIYILPAFLSDKAMAVFLAEPIADFIAVATTVTMFTFSFKATLKKMRAPA